MIQATLCFILREGFPRSVLLGKKKRGFGEGKHNGIGGKLEPGELPEHGIIREVQEEVGLILRGESLQSVGHITFRFPYCPEFDHFVHVFLATEWEGVPSESEEMSPAWFAVCEIPFEQMWQDDAFWLPIVLSGKTIHATFEFGEDNETVVSWFICGGRVASTARP
jgi:ADP-ribose pyrophosphatase YjhB (NUDIX family)